MAVVSVVHLLDAVPQPFWTLVLAGGAGSRLRTVTGDMPKQFWSPDGRRTLVEMTIERVAGLTGPGRIVTVIGPGQQTHAERVTTPLGLLVQQTVDLGTGVGVLIGLCAILRRSFDPNPVVLVTPADHGVGCVAEFRAGIRFGVEAVATGRQRAVLFGAVASAPVTDYGWILPDASRPPEDRRFRRVLSVVEKPSATEAARLLTGGAVWNTKVLIARASTLLGMFYARCPEVLVMAAEGGDSSGLPMLDFSRDILSGSGGMAVYTWPESLQWTDLGTPARLRHWQQAS